MPAVSRFNRRRRTAPPARPPSAEMVRIDMRGLDLTTPHDVMQQNRTPRARNFRIYAEESDDRRVTISSRKGAGDYLLPIDETLNVENVSTTGQADQLIEVGTSWKGMKFTPTTSGRLTAVGLTIKNVLAASGPIVIKIFSDDSNNPDELLAESGILNSDVSISAYTNTIARLLEAPAVVSGTPYWLVAYIQDDGENSYYWRSNTSTTLAKTSINSGLSWSTTTYSLNFKTYITPDRQPKGIARFAPASGTNRTVLALNDSVYYGNDNTGAWTSIVSGLSTATENFYFDFMDGKVFWVDAITTGIKFWDGTSLTTVTHAELPVLRLAVEHKNRIFGVSAADPNKLVFSEDPGNDDGAGHEWYEAWLSTSFIYVPSPKANDPITAIVPFQDTLVIFTRTNKYVLYGTDPGSFTVRQASGNKGATSQNAVYADENNIYFVATDGFYRYNGSADEIISDRVQTEVGNIANLDKVFVTKWKRQVRFYYASSGQAFNNHCLIWHTVFEEWMLDTDAYVSHAAVFSDGDDNNELAEASSLVGAVHMAEMDDHNLGKAIDFVYDCKPDAMSNPARKKRIVKFYPLLEGEGGDYPVLIGMNKDRDETDTYTTLDLTTEGAKIGTFLIGDGTTIGGFATFAPRRLRTSGYAYYWQLRIKRRAIKNPVNFIGYVLSYRMKRL